MPDTSGNDDIQDSRLGSLQSNLDGDNFEAGPLPAGLLTTKPGALPPPGSSRKLPLATPENFVCLRGPCRHLMETTSPAEVENDDYEPIATDRWCKALPGVLLELTESAVYSCSDWDPEVKSNEREKRRKDYLRSDIGKKCMEAEETRERLRTEARAKIDATYSEEAQKRKLQEVNKQIDIDSGNCDPQDDKE